MQKAFYAALPEDHFVPTPGYYNSTEGWRSWFKARNLQDGEVFWFCDKCARQTPAPIELGSDELPAHRSFTGQP